MSNLDRLVNDVNDTLKQADNISTFGVQAGDNSWVGEQISTQSDPMIDPGVGKPYVLRTFEFSKNPEFKGKINKQEIFNKHWRQISTILWGDGLVPVEDINPRVEFTKNGNYRIFILAEARLNTLVVDKPKTLQQILKKKK